MHGFAALLVAHESTNPNYRRLGHFVGYGAMQLYCLFPGGQAGVFLANGIHQCLCRFDFITRRELSGTHARSRRFTVDYSRHRQCVNGVSVGHFIVKSHPKGEWAKVGLLAAAGGIFLALGWLLDLVIPVNKDLWTSSFVLVTSGWNMILLAVFYALVDVLNGKKSAFFFVVIGTNAIIIYLASSLVDWKYIAQSVFGGLVLAFA